MTDRLAKAAQVATIVSTVVTVTTLVLTIAAWQGGKAERVGPTLVVPSRSN